MNKNLLNAVIDYAKKEKMDIIVQPQTYFNNLMLKKNDLDGEKFSLNEAGLRYQIKNKNIHEVGLLGGNENEHNLLKKEIFINFIKIERNNPNSIYKNDKEIFAEMRPFLGFNWKNMFLEIVDRVNVNNDQLIKNMHDISIGEWQINFISLEKIDELFKKRNVEENKIDNFYYKFIKSRKNHLKISRNWPPVKEFLLNKYANNKDYLEKYFDFFEPLKQEFEGLNFKLKNIAPTNSVVFRFDTNYIAKSLCIPNCSEYGIQGDLIALSKAITKTLGFNEVFFKNKEKGAPYTEIVFLSDNEIDRDKIIKINEKFLLFKKENYDLNINESFLEKWILMDALTEELPQLSIKKKSNKI